MSKKLTTEAFKKQLSIEHPELELLSDYKGNKEYVTVKCKIHDHVFNTKPNWLHSGCSCQKCYNERRGSALKKDIKSFIEDAKKIHKDKYDYSKVEYINSKTKVCIVCKEHGEFWQTPNKHLQGQGCPKCIGKNKTTSDIIKLFQKIHNNIYDYSKVSFINNATKICIICPKHGEFWQTPDKHLRGEGCPICKSSKLEKKVRDFLIENNIIFTSQAHFDWLGKQSLDFYLPSCNIAIECQGEQHFKEYSGKLKIKTSLEKRIRLDIGKNKLCEENGIKIIYFFNEKWEKTSKTNIFNGIYDKNVILEDNIEKIKMFLKK